mmetsp:Transcript_43919/g.94022  ORF Transcript_43919/g.94022 Transcript_43919/m.94022 type:complete len:212 (-) Transcript_43919:1208-1843(-)
MPASVNWGSRLHMEIFSCHRPSLRRSSNRWRATFSTNFGVQISSLTTEPFGGVAVSASVVSCSSSDEMSAQLFCLDLVLDPSELCERVRFKVFSAITTGLTTSGMMGSMDAAMETVSTGTPASLGCCIYSLRMRLEPPSNPLLAAFLSWPRAPFFSILRHTDWRMEDRLRHWPPWDSTNSSTFDKASRPSFSPRVDKARTARSSAVLLTID